MSGMTFFQKVKLRLSRFSFIQYLKAKYLMAKYDHVVIDSRHNVAGSSHFEGYNLICEDVTFSGTLGYGSYIGTHSDLADAKIGRFTSIAPHVDIVQGIHPTSTFVSTHPAFFPQTGLICSVLSKSTNLMSLFMQIKKKSILLLSETMYG